MAHARIQIPAQLGSLLRDARLQRGLTQSAMAERLGVTTQAFSRLERCAERASFERVFRMCKLLGLEIEFVPNEPAPASSPAEW